MSRGPGHVQRAIVAIFSAEPHRVFSSDDLAAVIYPDQTIAKRHTDAVDRALRLLAPHLGLTRCRVRPWKSTAWFNVWGIATNAAPLTQTKLNR